MCPGVVADDVAMSANVMMPKPARRSIVPRRMSSLLVLLLLLILLPVVFVQAVVYHRWLQMRYQVEVHTSVAAARATAATFDEYVRDIGRDEATIGQAFLTWPHHTPVQVDQLLAADVPVSRYVRALHWVTPGGKISASSDRRAVGISVANKAWFRQALATHGRIISDTHQSRFGYGTTFVVARSIRAASDQPMGVVAASVDLQGLEDAAVRNEQLRDGAVAILDRHARLVRSYPTGAAVWRKQPLHANSAILAALSGKQTSCRVRLRDGSSWAVAYVPVGELGWVAGAARSSSLVMAPVWREILLAAGTALAALAASVLFSLLINHRINCGVRRLCAHVDALVHGDLDHRANVGGIEEFRVLADAVNQLAVWLNESQAQTRKTLDRLNALNETLEQRVAERTVEVQQRASQLRRLAMDLTDTEQRERHRLAQILHDHLQQLLVGAKLNLGMLRYQQPGAADDPSVQQVDSLLQESIAVSRSLAVDLSPPILYDQGLAAALHWLGNWAREKYGLKVTVDAAETVNCRVEQVNVLLFNAVRELLFNIVKHAQTDRATVGMCHPSSDQVRIIVADAGIGFDPAQRRRQDDTATGLGLFSIGERLELLGGHMEIDQRRRTRHANRAAGPDFASRFRNGDLTVGIPA